MRGAVCASHIPRHTFPLQVPFPLDSDGSPRPVFFRRPAGARAGWEVALQPGDLPPCSGTQAGPAPPAVEH